MKKYLFMIAAIFVIVGLLTTYDVVVERDAKDIVVPVMSAEDRAAQDEMQKHLESMPEFKAARSPASLQP